MHSEMTVRTHARFLKVSVLLLLTVFPILCSFHDAYPIVLVTLLKDEGSGLGSLVFAVVPACAMLLSSMAYGARHACGGW
jgi:hypothetical protein